ncbi:MAG: hypothetical protein SF162_08595 [bacterium]|nr:hypothetical protein [bacterium]
MHRWIKRTVGRFMAAVCAGIMAGCGAGSPSVTVSQGETLARYPFDDVSTWEFYNDSERGIFFGITDGEYRARIVNEALIWTLNGQAHTDVIMQVDTLQFSTDEQNGYGLICRASANQDGDGYYFLVSGDGNFTIRRGVSGVVEPIIPWTRSAAVAGGQNPNRLRVVCVGDYLALYINGQFVAEARDSRYQRGYAGITAVVPGDRSVEVTFDDLTIWDGSLGEP